MAKHPKGKESPVSQRVRRIRELMGYQNATAFCARYNLDYKRWKNYENGYAMPTDAAVQLCQIVPGLTLDWLFRGRLEGMPLDLIQRLEPPTLERTAKRRSGNS